MTLASCWAVLWIRAVMWFDRLPGRIPVHFNGSGVPDRLVEKTWLAWLTLPIIATALSLGIVLTTGPLMSYLARHKPGLINMPDQERWMRLNPDARSRALGSLADAMKFECVVIVGLFIWILESSARVAVGQWTNAAIWPVFFVPIATIIIVPWALIGIRKSVDRELAHADAMPCESSAGSASTS